MTSHPEVFDFPIPDYLSNNLDYLRALCTHQVGSSEHKREYLIKPENESWCDKLWESMLSVTKDYGLRVCGMDNPQRSMMIFVRYPPQAYTDYHMDRHKDSRYPNGRWQTLSSSLIIRCPNLGGAMRFDTGEILDPPVGSLIVFPGELYHQVLPVEMGERLSLVARWMQRRD